MPTRQRSTRMRSPFGELLYNLRTERALTQERLAHSVHGDSISPRSITNYERVTDNPKDWILPHRSGLRLLTEALDLDPIDHRALVRAWSLSRSMRATKPQVSTIPSGFVPGGREQAENILMKAWELARFGSPQFVLIDGISGVGKTALVRHVVTSISSSDASVAVGWGNASAWATELEPFLAIRNATDRLITPPVGAAISASGLSYQSQIDPSFANRVIDSIPTIAGPLVSEPALRSMASQQSSIEDGDLERALSSRGYINPERRFKEYASLLTDLSRFRPIVLVLEDLHWAGELTLSLFAFLVEQTDNVHDTPILVIGTYRSDEIAPTSTTAHPVRRMLNAITTSPHVRRVHLNKSMNHEEGVAFIRDLLEPTPLESAKQFSELAEWLFNQTSGHALLTVEMLRHLIETKALHRPEGQGLWQFDEQRFSEQLPPAVTAYVDQRLQRIPTETRNLLEIASAMNYAVLSDVLAKMLNVNEQEITDLMDTQLVDTHQLLEHTTSSIIHARPRAMYRFPHAIYSEHIYDGLTPSRRKHIHLAIAQTMEELYPDANSEMLSEITNHYLRAEDWHNAYRFANQLSVMAEERLDWDAADLWSTNAEEYVLKTKNPEALWSVRASHVGVLRGLQRHDEALKLGQRALSISEAMGWQQIVGLTSQLLGEIYYDLGRHDEANTILDAAVKINLEIGEWHLASTGYTMLSHVKLRMGKYDRALTLAESGLELATRTENHWVKPEAVMAIANCQTDLGMWEEAIQSYQTSIDLAASIGKDVNQRISMLNIALSHLRAGRPEYAIELLTELEQIMHDGRTHRLTGPLHLYYGFAHESQGRWDLASDHYSLSVAIRRGLSAAPTILDSLAGTLRVATHRQDTDKVRSVIEEILLLFDTYADDICEYPIMVHLALANGFQMLEDDASWRKQIERGHEILQHRVENLQSAEAQHSLTHNMKENAELLRIYASLT